MTTMKTMKTTLTICPNDFTTLRSHSSNPDPVSFVLSPFPVLSSFLVTSPFLSSFLHRHQPVHLRSSVTPYFHISIHLLFPSPRSANTGIPLWKARARSKDPVLWVFIICPVRRQVEGPRMPRPSPVAIFRCRRATRLKHHRRALRRRLQIYVSKFCA